MTLFTSKIINTEIHSSTGWWGGGGVKQEYIAYSEVTSNNIFFFSLKYELPNLGSSVQFLA